MRILDAIRYFIEDNGIKNIILIGRAGEFRNIEIDEEDYFE